MKHIATGNAIYFVDLKAAWNILFWIYYDSNLSYICETFDEDYDSNQDFFIYTMTCQFVKGPFCDPSTCFFMT